MMLISIPSNKQDDLKQRLSQMKDMSATVFVADDKHDNVSSFTPKVAYQGFFSLEGADNPGIVHIVTTALARHGLNIDKMETDQEIAPHGGTVLFRMKGKAVAYEPLASGFVPSQIRYDLQELGASLNCDVELEDMEDDESTSASFYAG
jgi:glycine cleavage system transcriptional repressor